MPFCLESKLSGVGRLLEPFESLWYHRVVELAPQAGPRTLLHFEAVDYPSDQAMRYDIEFLQQAGERPSVG